MHAYSELRLLKIMKRQRLQVVRPWIVLHNRELVGGE